MLPPFSNMQAVGNGVSNMIMENNMEVNPTITKKLIIYFCKNPVFPSLITIDGFQIERVGQSKLLGMCYQGPVTPYTPPFWELAGITGVNGNSWN